MERERENGGRNTINGCEHCRGRCGDARRNLFDDDSRHFRNGNLSLHKLLRPTSSKVIHTVTTSTTLLVSSTVVVLTTVVVAVLTTVVVAVAATPTLSIDVDVTVFVFVAIGRHRQPLETAALAKDLSHGGRLGGARGRGWCGTGLADSSS